MVLSNHMIVIKKYNNEKYVEITKRQVRIITITALYDELNLSSACNFKSRVQFKNTYEHVRIKIN